MGGRTVSYSLRLHPLAGGLYPIVGGVHRCTRDDLGPNCAFNCGNAGQEHDIYLMPGLLH